MRFIKNLINKYKIKFNKELNSLYWKTIREEIEILNKRISETTSKENSERRRYAIDRNSNCSKCNSKNVLSKYERVKGKGSFDMSGDFVFGIGSIHGSGKSSIDTHKVNECGDCGNQWEIYDYDYKLTYKELKSYIRDFYWYMYRFKRYELTTYDPKDLSDSFKSLDDKRNSYKESMNLSLKDIQQYSDGISIDTILELYKENGEWDIRETISFFKSEDRDKFLKSCGMYNLQRKLIKGKQ